MSETTKILPIERWKSFTRKLPYGVVKTGFMTSEDKLTLLPDPDKIVIIEQAFDYIEAGSAYRETADWLTQKLKQSVTHQTLSNLYKTYRKPYVNRPTNRRKGHKMSAESRKIIGEKTRLRAQARKIEALQKKAELKRRQLQDTDFPEGRPEPVERTDLPRSALSEIRSPMKTIGFKPNPGPQSRFLSATELEVLYGGAAGGGKSFAMIADPMRYFENPNFVGLLLRRTNDELRELIRETQKIYPIIFKGAQFQAQKSMWKFPSGAEFWITYLDRDDDVLRYQGQSFCWIGIDELTQYSTSYAYTYLKSRLRTSDPELKKHLSMRATTNPGGPGHQWVKKMFVDPQIPGKPFWATDENGEVLLYPDDPKYGDLAGKPLNKRLFIPAKLMDNPYLHDDGTYERNLLGLPEDQRRKLLDGDWSVVEGAAFPEFNPKIHVIEDREIPDHWQRFRAGDYGYGSYSAVLWFAIEPGSNQLVVYREIYKSKVTGIDLAYLVMSAERNEKVKYGVLDSSVWHERGNYGPSIAEEMISKGCRWRKSDRGNGSRIAGKNRLHELLKVDPYTGRPGIVFFESCRQIIADLPMIPSDPDGGEDIDDRYKSDHTYDALRYGIMSRPKQSGWGDWDTKSHVLSYQPVDSKFGY